MKLHGPIVAGLVLVVPCVGAPPARAVVLQQGRSAARPNAAQSADADEQYNYVAGLFEKGFHDMVVTEARRFLEKWPGHGRAALVRYRLGQSLFEQKKWADARTELAKLEPTPRDFEYSREVAFRVGQCTLELGEFVEAAHRFDQLAAAGDGHYLIPAAAFYAGEAHFRAEEFAAAAKAYGQAIQSGDAEYARGALYGMGWALFKAGEFETASQALQLFLQKFPQDPSAGEAQFLFGECRVKVGKPAEALAAFQKVPAGEWFDDALSAAGFVCAQLKDDAKAAQLFLRLEQSVPDSPLLPEARLHAGIHLQKLGRDDEAAAVLDRLLADTSGDAGTFTGEACYWRGLVAKKKGGAAAALPFFERGLSAKPAKELGQRLALARADALFDAGRFDEAKQAYAKAGGSSEDAAYSSAVAALNGGDQTGAAELARDFLARYPQGRHAAAASLVLGEGLFAQKKWADALPAFDAAAAAGDEAAEGRATLRPRALSRGGWCLFSLGRFADAAEKFTLLVNEFPKDERAAEASFMAGRALLRGGDAEGAAKALQRHLDQYGKSDYADDARYDLAQSQRALGKPEEAQRLLERLARGGGNANPALAQRAALESAELHAAADEHDEALAALAPLVAANPPPELLRPALYAQAWSLFALARHDEATTALSALLADPQLPADIAVPALELQVSVARGRKDGAAARSAFDRLVKQAPDGERTPEVALTAALALDEAGDAAGGARLLEEATRRWPRFAGRDRMVYQRALLVQKAGDVEAARALFLQVETQFAASPLAPEAAFQVGESLYAAGDFDGALPHYAKAAVEGSRVADAALYKSGWCHFQKERFAEAADFFGQLAQRFARSELTGEARYLAGEALYRTGAYEPALVRLGEFLQHHPRHEHRAKGLFRQGLCLGELGRMNECQDALTLLETDYPDFELRPEADLWIGRACLARKRTNDALARFDAVIQADRGILAARAHLGRGDTLRAQGKLEDALGEFLKVSLLFSSDPEVSRALWQAGQCLEQLGDKEKAKARYRELVEQHPKAPEVKDAKARLAELDATKSF